MMETERKNRLETMGNTRLRRAAPAAVDRKTALAAEEAFFERLAANVNATPGIFSPVDNRTYDASPRNRVTKLIDDGSTEVKGLVKRFAERDLMKTYEEMPKNGIVLYEIVHRELLSRPTLKIVIAGASFNPSEELVRKGTSSRRAGSGELARVRDTVLQAERTFHYLAAFSPTGWEESARTALVGSNYLVALCDLHEQAWRTFWTPDPRWRSALRVFDLSTDEEKIEAVRRWVRRHTFELLMDELTEDTVFEELGYAIPIIREAFGFIAREDPYVRFDTASRPYRLVRTYGGPDHA